MCEYFIVLVNLCHKLLKFTQKSSLGQFKASVADGDLKTSQTNLELWATKIRDEVQMLMAETITDEAVKNSNFREFSKTLSKSSSHKRQLDMYLKMLDFCSTYDHTVTWKQNRKAGTTRLFCASVEYKNWKDQFGSGTLVYTASLGSGKSVLLANLVDDLHLHVQDSHVPVVYFFCRYDITESLQARTIIGSIARQLLGCMQPQCRDPDLTMGDLLDRKNRLGDIDIIFYLLRRVLACDLTAYIVVDGIDECELSERRILIEELKRLQKTFSIRLCISLRLEPNSPLEVNTDGLMHATITPIPDNSSDIEAFIQAELESCIESQRLVVGDPHLILEIRDTLSQRSQGMFLWVVLQIETLCMMDSDHAIRQALEDLPNNLRETFSRILQRSERPGVLNQRAVLELITAAHSPLTTEQIREALSVVPGNTVWDPSRLPNDINATLACCGCLITLDEEELTVRLVHPSFKQFLLDEPDYVNLEAAHERMTGIIITYLSYDVFESQISTTVIPEIKAGSAPATIAKAALPSSGNIRNLALKLLRSKHETEFDIGKALAQARPSRHISNQFHLRNYAQFHWCSHLLKFKGLSRRLSQLLIGLLKAKRVSPISECIRSFPNHSLLYGSPHFRLDLGFWTNRDRWNQTFEPPILHLAVVSGHDLFVEAVIDHGGFNINFMDSTEQTAIMLAVLTRNVKIFDSLLGVENVDVSLKSWVGYAPLHMAIRDSSEDILKIMLESKKFDVNIRDKPNRRTALHIAVLRAKADMVELLLGSESIDTSILDEDALGPIHHAARLERSTVMRILTRSSKVDVNLRGPQGRTAIHMAALNEVKGFAPEYATSTLAVLLASENIDTNAKDENGMTALHLTVVNLRSDMSTLLLSPKVDVNAADNDGKTALHIAVELEKTAHISQLLSHSDCDINARDKYGCTPLHLAATFKSYKSAAILLNSEKIDLNAKDSIRRTALHIASGETCLPIVTRLLEFNEVDVNAQLETGKTALHFAARQIQSVLEPRETDWENAKKGGPPFTMQTYNTIEVFMRLFKSERVDTALEDDIGRTAERFLTNAYITVDYLEDCLMAIKDISKGEIGFGQHGRLSGGKFDGDSWGGWDIR
jgi:ankyrin repeat protein